MERRKSYLIVKKDGKIFTWRVRAHSEWEAREEFYKLVEVFYEKDLKAWPMRAHEDWFHFFDDMEDDFDDLVVFERPRGFDGTLPNHCEII